MKRFLTVALALSLSACVGGLTPRQSVYAAYGAYSAALDGAVAYAESPSASPAVVARLNAVNQSEPVREAVRYGKAFTRCQGSNATIVEGLDCKAFDFSPKTADGYVRQLRVVVSALSAR